MITAATGLRLTRTLKVLVRSRTAHKNTDQKKDKSCLEVVKCSFVYETGSSDPKHSSKVMAKAPKSVWLKNTHPIMTTSIVYTVQSQDGIFFRYF